MGVSSPNATVDLMREYRKIDDSVAMRLNRTAAQFRERDGRGGNQLDDGACGFFFAQLVGAFSISPHASNLVWAVLNSSWHQQRTGKVA